jgi:histidinol-phosphate aminotransferase
VQYFSPSYSLYPVLADIAGAARNAVALNSDFSLPEIRELSRRGWNFSAALSFITTPNAPSGHGYATSDLGAICERQRGVVVLDEAYVDFAPENAMDLALRHPNVIVSRTFSKSYALCFQRVGYFVGPSELIAALHKIRDSYNVNGLGQVAAAATLDDLPYYRRLFKRIVTSRDRLSSELARVGFRVLPSQTNFVLCQPPRFPAKTWLDKLRARRILVRWWDSPEVRNYLRISIGTDAEIDAVLKASDAILRRR